MAFIEHDEWPMRPEGKGKRKLSLSDMEAVAIRELAKISTQLSDTPLTQLFPFRPKELHGFVHGGPTLVSRYRISDKSMGFNAPDSELLSLLGSFGLVAGYALTYIAPRIANHPGEEPATLRAAHDAFRAEVLGN